MARKRNVHPKFFINEDIAELDPLTRLFFIGMWTLADRDGRMEDRPKKLKGEILPYDNCDGEEMVSSIADKGFIVRYEISGKRYIQIVNWLKYQDIHPKEALSVIPTSCMNDASAMQEPCINEKTNLSQTQGVSVNPIPSIPSCTSYPSLKEKNLRACEDDHPVDNFPEGDEGGAAPSPDDNPDFMEFMSVYPRREEIGKAKKAWEKAVFSGAKPILIVGAARKYAAEMKAEGRETQYIKMPYNFILDQIPFEARCPACELYSQCEGRGWYTIDVEYLGHEKTETVACPYRLKGAG